MDAMDNQDLPEHIARMLRDVPTAENRDRHIATALESLATVRGVPSAVVPFRRVVLAAAAAVLLALSAGALGWTLRGDTAQPLAMDDVSAREVSGVKGNTSAVPAQAADSSPTSTCDVPELKGAVWLGTYTIDRRTYSLFVNNLSVMWYDLATCMQALAVPHPATTAP